MAATASFVFVSYARVDAEFASRLSQDLASSGVSVWVDTRDITAGDCWDASVEQALLEAAAVVLILSPFACASQSVMDEVSFAQSQDKRVIPVLYQDCSVPFRWARIQQVDMRHDFESGLAKVLEALDLIHPARAPVPKRALERAPVSRGLVTVHHVEADNVVIADTVGDITFKN